MCSSIDTLREVAGDAAELVDPLDVDAIAAGLHRVWSDANRAHELVIRGKQRAAQYTWEATGVAYRALYASIAAGERVA